MNKEVASTLPPKDEKISCTFRILRSLKRALAAEAKARKRSETEILEASLAFALRDRLEGE
jgi:hypothetical protein